MQMFSLAENYPSAAKSRYKDAIKKNLKSNDKIIMFVKHECPWMKQTPYEAKILISYISPQNV